MADPARSRRSRVAAVLAAALAVVTAACTAAAPEPAPPADQVATISYAGAGELLTTLDDVEADEQVRDWARLGLASTLDVAPDRLVDALFDTAAVRDTALAGVAEQPVGPGRALFDGATLHLLVPQDDPMAGRTIGQLLDQHRADAGTDPAQAQVHRYAMHPEAMTIELSAEPVTTVAQLRSEHGWLERRVDTMDGLSGFLETADHLTRLETRGVEIWASGWDWPGVTPMMSAEDVSALQRAYRQRQLPGFSLDPGPPSTPEDVRATIPGLSPELAARIVAGDFAGSPFASAEELAGVVIDALVGNLDAATMPEKGLPSDRTELWAVRNLLLDGSVYSQARYEGGLAGTEVGMTLFYTDYLAKDWSAGVGMAVPPAEVGGFVPDTRAQTPPDLCPDPGSPLNESGRLWFGQNDSAYTYGSTGVDIGAQGTRLFFLSDAGDGTEVEPGYRFGRALREWDRRFQAVADYEPQYHRLDQIMRWSGALEWLTYDGDGVLPQVPDSAIRSDLTFADWYADHTDLRERNPLRIVTPPSATAEAVLPVPSPAVDDCGVLNISGGVSLADGLARRGGSPQASPVPPGARRAWPIDPAATRLDPITGSGRIERVSPVEPGRTADPIVYAIRRAPDGATVTVTGPPSIAVRIGDVRLVAENGPRTRSTEFRAEESRYLFDESVNGEPLAGITVTKNGPAVEVALTPRFGDVLRSVVDRFRGSPDRMPTGPPFRYEYSIDGPVVRIEGQGWGGWARRGAPSESFQSTVVTTFDGQRLEFGTPKRPGPEDLNGFSLSQEPVATTFGALSGQLPVTARVFRNDVAPGSEPPSTLPGVISADAPIVFQVAEPRVDGGTPVPPRSGWMLVPVPGGDPSDAAGGGPAGGGPPDNGGGLDGPTLDGLADGSFLVFVTVCEPDDQDRVPAECR